jgi:hypothetical protein
MSVPEIQIVGVYDPCLNQKRCELFVRGWLAQLRGLPPKRLTELEQAFKGALRKAMLVEVMVINADDRFSVDDFCQPDPSLSERQWQAAWNEVFLSPDGNEVGSTGVPHPPRFRVAFYIHFWRADLNLATSYGRLLWPKPQAIPERLWKLAPYDLTD